MLLLLDRRWIGGQKPNLFFFFFFTNVFETTLAVILLVCGYHLKSQETVWALTFTYNQVMIYLSVFDIDCNFGIMKLDVFSFKSNKMVSIYRQVGTVKEREEVLCNHFTTLCCIGCTVV